MSDTSLLSGEAKENSSLLDYLNKGAIEVGLPDGSKVKFKKKAPKKQYTDLRKVFIKDKPFQEPGDFKKKPGRKGKKKVGRPKEKPRVLTKEEQRKLKSLNVISSKKKKIKELMEGGMSFAKSKNTVLKIK